MKLPLFHIQRQFKDLFKEMDTEYQKNEVNVWNFQGDSILDRIIKEGEVIVEEGDISNYIEDDGFFRVEGKLVLVYIRDQFIRRNPYNDSYDQEITEEYIKENQSYRYHLIECQTIRKAISDQRRNRYVLRSPSYKGEKGDDKFKINIIEKSSKDILLTMNDTLKVCKHCLNQGNINSYKDYPERELEDIETNDVESFDEEILSNYYELSDYKIYKSSNFFQLPKIPKSTPTCLPKWNEGSRGQRGCFCRTSSTRMRETQQ